MSSSPQAVKNNGTLYLHVVVGLAGTPLDASLDGYNASKVFNRTFPAVAYHPRPKKKDGVSLLSSSSSSEKEEEEKGDKGAATKKSKASAVDNRPKKEEHEEEEEEDDGVPLVGGGWGGSGSSSKGGKKRKAKGGSSKEKPESSSSPPREIISFFKPNLTVAMVDDFQVYAKGKIPEQVRKKIVLLSFFFPLVFLSKKV